MHVTQPALTKGVQKLEQELGGPLIYRERQLTQLTDLGKEVLPMLERTLTSAEAVRRRAPEFQRKEVAPPGEWNGNHNDRAFLMVGVSA